MHTRIGVSQRVIPPWLEKLGSVYVGIDVLSFRGRWLVVYAIFIFKVTLDLYGLCQLQF